MYVCMYFSSDSRNTGGYGRRYMGEGTYMWCECVYEKSITGWGRDQSVKGEMVSCEPFSDFIFGNLLKKHYWNLNN